MVNIHGFGLASDLFDPISFLGPIVKHRLHKTRGDTAAVHSLCATDDRQKIDAFFVALFLCLRFLTTEA